MILTGMGICKSYGSEKVLHQVNCSFESGKATAILGESGKGKSTLISILGLLLKPDAGDVLLDGRNILSISEEEKASIRNHCFGFMFQYPQLIGSITAIENVMIPALLADVRGTAGGHDRKKQAEALLEELGLADRMNHYPFQLSLGQKRRVSLARTLLMNPDIIFADEPTNDLDEKNATIVCDKLFEMKDRGRTLILVTHDSKLAERADVVMRIGE